VIVCGALGITLFEDAEAGPVPTLFIAATVNVYAAPLVSPVMTIGLEAPINVKLSGLDVTV
jgi:hypothetical protein